MHTNKHIKFVPLDPDRNSIFLDIDGVLNGTRSSCAIGCGHGHVFLPDFEHRGRHVLFEESDSDQLVQFCSLLDPVAVGLLGLIVAATNAQIIISSTWRLGIDLDKIGAHFGRMFRAYGHEFDVVSATPSFYGSEHIREGDQVIGRNRVLVNSVRGHEIRWFVEKHGIKNYIIIDDDSDMLVEQKDRFIHTSQTYGLVYKDVLDAVQVLDPTKIEVRETRLILPGDDDDELDEDRDGERKPREKRSLILPEGYLDRRYEDKLKIIRKEIGDAKAQRVRAGSGAKSDKVRETIAALETMVVRDGQPATE